MISKRLILFGASLLAVSSVSVLPHLDAQAQDASPVPGPNALQPPRERSPSCMDGGCHANEVNYPRLHGPVAAGACTACHAYSSIENHTFELKRAGAQLCSFCHIGKTDVEGLHVHEPVAEGECLHCHHPHGSTQARLLRGASQVEVCTSCHLDITNKAHLHAPVTEGRCTDCHRAHTSLHDKLLIANGRDLCMTCHEAAVLPAHAAPMPAAFAIATAQVVGEQSMLMPLHAPVADDCAKCHDPHSSDQPALLSQEPMTLCLSCHTDIAEKVSSARVAHSAVSDDRACLNCHVAHSSGVHSLLKEWPNKLCMSCHGKPVARADGTMVAAATDLDEPHQFIHDPLQGNTCITCHDVHGGMHPNLLTHAYTPNFYEQFSTQAYELCLSCHQEQMLTEPQTTTATNFRNGARNLHYVHVVEPANGRSCRACHATHSAEVSQLLRAGAPFGEWTIPIEFQGTATGGSCAAGCHRARGYDREQPVPYDSLPPP